MISVPIKRRRRFRHSFSISQDGVITGAADNDPAGIATYLQVGATTGFSLLWLMVLITPLTIAIEEMSARIGVITKKGLARIIRERYGPTWAYIAAFIVLLCNIATITANIAAMAEILSVFTGISWAWFVLPIAAVLLAVLIAKSYATISRYLIITTLVLILYIITGIMMQPSLSDVLAGVFRPVFELDNLFLLAGVGLIGTTIAPYLIFWQATSEIEDNKQIKDLRQESFGVALGFIFAGLVAFFIIIAAAMTFGGSELIPTTTEAALALKPLVGHWAFLFFAIGILGSGLLGIPVLASSTAYVGAEAMRLPEGLSKTVKQAPGFYVLLIATLFGAGLLGLSSIPPMLMLLYSQVLNGILTPVLIILLMLLANDKRIMKTHRNGFWSNCLGIVSLVVMIGFDIALLVTYL
ncbi:MAG: Nramp family divalent metal transporter [Patescibacteria group bacterium]|nr:Nramp family divalent metal transporter [Patescibacteria group bacterium]